MCSEPKCEVAYHAENPCAMYDDIVNCLYASTAPFHKHKCNVSNIRAVWNEFVAEIHAATREAFRNWSVASRPRPGVLLDIKELTNARY